LKKFITIKVLSRAAGVTGALLIPMGFVGKYIKGLFINDAISISAGFILLLLSRWMSKQTIINTRRFSLRAMTIIISSIVVINLVAGPSIGSSIAYQGELEDITMKLHPSYLKFEEEIESYIAELLDNNSLSIAEKDQLIDDLNNKIQIMEDEAALFEELRLPLQVLVPITEELLQYYQHLYLLLLPQM